MEESNEIPFKMLMMKSKTELSFLFFNHKLRIFTCLRWSPVTCIYAGLVRSSIARPNSPSLPHPSTHNQICGWLQMQIIYFVTWNHFKIKIAACRGIIFLHFRLMPLTAQPFSFSRGEDFDVITTIYCMSRHVRLGLASKANATNPAANGAEAEVPGKCWKGNMKQGEDRQGEEVRRTLTSMFHRTYMIGSQSAVHVDSTYTLIVTRCSRTVGRG